MSVQVASSMNVADRPDNRCEAAEIAVPTLLLAVACGAIAANIYYLQPLAALVAQSVGLRPSASGLVASMTHIGYGIGLLLIVPLADLMENRRLVGIVLGFSIAALVVAALAPEAAVLLPAAFAIGLGSVGVQLVVVYATHLAPERERGRVIGAVTSGLMLGIMLSRPVASGLAALSSWRVVLGVAAVLTGAIALCLRYALPRRPTQSSETYRSLVASLPMLYLEHPIVRWRTVIHCSVFFGFGLFWTAIPLVLGDRFQLGQSGIAMFGLTGIASVLAAPLAGRVADRGYALTGTAASILLVATGFAAAILVIPDQGGLSLLGIAALLIGAGVTGHAVFAQRDIFGTPPAIRARLNGVFMAAYFGAGALGSAIAGLAYAQWGWGITCALGLGTAAVAMVRFLLSVRRMTAF
jgi:predicted MFS family arabinose efflux permease